MLARLTLAAVVTAAGLAHATPQDDRLRASHDQPIEVMAAAGVGKGVRSYVDTRDDNLAARRDAGWTRFRAALPGLDAASFDRATGVPARIWGRGLDVPGAVADPAIALAAARRVLAEQLAVLAPGARIDDFELVANHLDRATGLRTIGFAQRFGGLRVVGGQVSFRFKHDRLFVIGSEALPHVAVAWPRAGKRAREVATALGAATSAEFGLDPTTVTTRTAGVPEILPLVGDRGVLGYRVAIPVDIDAGWAGGWRVWADATTGAALVRRSITPSATGTIAFDAVVRHPGRPRQTRPAVRMTATVDGVTVQTDADGRVTWPGTAPATVVVTATGPDVAMSNVADPNRAPTRFTGTLAPDGTLTWRPGDDRLVDAQVSSFIHATVVRTYARRFAPELPFLDEELPVRVNIDKECNAFSDGTSINFFVASARCENTGTLADVVYHEFGHSVHHHAIIPGAGLFDGAFSEGLSDYLATTITGDSGMGRGFFRTDTALREIDPNGSENVWPRDVGEIHKTGMIFAGAMWDTRKALIAELGDEAAAVRLADQLFYGAVQRAANIPSTLIEVLATDDDDGDLSNGTPHECTIRQAFARHGLRTVTGAITAPSTLTSAATVGPTVRLALAALDTRCDDPIADVTLEWREGGVEAGTVTAELGDDAWVGTLPLPADGATLLYRFRVSFANNTALTFPDNRADPWFQLYRGDVEPLYCTDFETNPFAAGWRVGGDAGELWQWGSPGAQPGVGDPGQAYSGARVLGTALSFVDGSYRPGSLAWIESPRIDVGRFSDVRLQYRRWLTVEDGFYDHAKIEVNGEPAWANLTSQGSASHTTHHEDRVWAFHDVPLSSLIYDGTLRLRWSLEADDGLQFGGWNVDDVCIVANPRSVCGDGVRSPTEQCDDGPGNGDGPDQCRTSCRFAACGDGIVDASEECDDGNDDDDDDCDAACFAIADRPADVDGTCATSGGSGQGPGLAVGAGLAIAALVRRRRRAGR